MLKKAGIVVATAAVGLLAVSPLAFAGTSGKDHGYSHSAAGGLLAALAVATTICNTVDSQPGW